MHPYRGGPPREQDDEDVRAYARSARALQRAARAFAVTFAFVASLAIVAWPYAANILSGAFLGQLLRR